MGWSLFSREEEVNDSTNSGKPGSNNLEEGQRVFGCGGSAAGKGYGTVDSVKRRFGNDEVKVSWDAGSLPDSVHRSFELSATTM